MQHLNWDDLRFFLALSRSDSYNSAARALRVDGTTVSRRIKALEKTLQTRLVMRAGTGTFQLTDAAHAVAKAAEIAEREVEALQARLSNADIAIKGRVLLTAVPAISNRILIPALTKLLHRHPDLEIHLAPDNRNLNLTMRETDIAIRLGRPIDGGQKVIARRIGTLAHAVYAATDCADADGGPWVTYQAAMDHLPQAQWIEMELQHKGGAKSSAFVSDLEGAIEAVASGYGKTLLPCLFGDGDKRLRRLHAEYATPMIEREIWVLVHADMQRLARIRATLDWLDALFDPLAIAPQPDTVSRQHKDP